MINLKKNYALILALGLILTGCTGQTGTDETKATQTQEMTTSGTEEAVDTSPSADETTVDVQTTENKTEKDTTADKDTTDQETESEEESMAEETTAEEPTAEETEEPTAEEETTPETTAEPTTAEPTTPEPTTAEPTTPEPTTPEPTTPEPTTPAPTTPAPTEPTTAEPATTQPIVIVKAVKIEGSVSGTHYIGDTLSGADFTIKVTMSDGNVLTNPAGWAAAPLQLSAATNVITIAYGDVSNQITVNASERPTQPTQPTQNPEQPSSAAVYRGEDILHAAFNCLNLPYTLGGKDPSTGFDCSGFVQYCYKQVGIDIPGSPAAQKNCGVRHYMWDAKPGDILVVEDKAGNSIHTAIYAGAGLAYDATNPIGVSCRIVMLDPKSVPETYRYYAVRPGTNTSTQATTWKFYSKTDGYIEEPYNYAGQTSTWSATYYNFLNEALWERRGIDSYEAGCGFEINGKTLTEVENLTYDYSVYGERNRFEITPEEIGLTVDQMSAIATDIFG